MLRTLLSGADLAARAFARTGIRVRTLASDGQVPAVPKTAVAADLHKPLDVLAGLSPQVAFDLEVPVDELTESDDLFLGQIAHARARTDACLAQHVPTRGRSDAVDVGQASFNALLARQVDTCDTSHSSSLLLTLALLVARIVTDDENPAMTPYDFALVAHALH
jgi:hypothetical protein